MKLLRYDLVFFLALALAVAGCTPDPAVVRAPNAPGANEKWGDETPTGKTADKPAEKDAAKDAAPQWSSPGGKIKFKDGADKTLFSIKPKDNGAKLVDGSEPEKELFRYTWEGKEWRIKDPADKVVGYIVVRENYFEARDPDKKTTHFRLQSQPDGDYKLEDPAGKLLRKIKKRDYGWEIEDDAEKSLAKIKSKDGKTSARDAGDKTILATKDAVKTLAVACLALDIIPDQAWRAGFAVAAEGK